MKLLFSPAVALMNRMSYKGKFGLLWLASLVAISVVVYSLFVSLNQVIRISQQELEGIALIKPLSRSIQLIQQHRGLSAVLLGGNEAVRGRFAANEKEAFEAFGKMEEKLHDSLKETGEWRNLKANWERLRKEGLDWAIAENFAAHTRLIEQIQSLEIAAADQYKLTLDPEIDTYYLVDTAINKLPDTIEHIGQLRAYGVGILGRKQLAEPEKIMLYSIIAKLNDSLMPLDANLEKTGRYNPAIQRSLSIVSRDIADSARQITELVTSDILTGHFATSPEDFYNMITMVVDRNYTQLYESLLPTAEKLLKARITRAKDTLRTSIGFALLLILAVAYFAIGIYYSIIDGVRSLARSAHAFAGGNLRERVNLGTRDELGQVGDSLNKMADGFSALLEVRRQAEDTLNQFKNTLDQTQDCVFMFSPGTLKFIYANRGAAAQVGYSIEELLQLTPLDIKPEFTLESFRQMLKPMLAGQQAAITFETVHRHKDGHLIPVEIALQYIHHEGVGARFIAIVRDVTERRQANKFLKDSQEKLRAIFENSNDAIMLLAGKSFLECNQSTLKMFGITSKQKFISSHPADLSPPFQPDGRDSLSAANEKIMFAFEHGSSRFEWVHRRKNGEDFPADVLLSAFDYGGERILQATVRDISERKQAENELRKHYEELKALNTQLQEAHNQLMQSEKMASIGQLAAGVAHEINNPIGYVYSNLGTLEKYVQDAFGMIERYEQAEGAITDEAVRARLKAAREKLDIAFLKDDLRALMSESKDGITRVKKIVQNLKDFSHVDASDEWHFSSLHNGLDSTLNIVNNEIKYKADVVREYGDIPEVECLSSQLNQVFMNLLVNAAHAIEERGTITVRTGRQGEEVWVEIADTGKGIAPENIKKIFDPFFTTKPIGKGTGLGLSLSYGIIQKHHGRIEVQSEPGKGTVFRVWLPVKQPQAAQA